MNFILLTRRSDPQIFVANSLYMKGLLTDVIVEEGQSLETGFSQGTRKKIKRGLIDIKTPRIFLIKLMNLILFYRYYGNRDYHNKRILGEHYNEFSHGLEIHHVNNINDKESLTLIKNINPSFVYVFGTRMIKKNILDALVCPSVNMHWGWSPDYRGEGIVSALSNGGPGHLGVTIHLLDTTSDGGDIIVRERPIIDSEDNFYSIGLKLSIIGCKGFVETIRSYHKERKIVGERQNLAAGRLYGISYTRNHPESIRNAWVKLQEYIKDEKII